MDAVELAIKRLDARAHDPKALLLSGLREDLQTLRDALEEIKERLSELDADITAIQNY